MPANRQCTAKAPLILVGAFDRHNLGDLLFPHIICALLPEAQPLFAGLAQRDMRAYGGHQVLALADLMRQHAGQPVRLIHVGGELLDCDLYQAAIMLHSAPEARQLIRRYDADPSAGLRWAQQQLGLQQQCAYLADKRCFAEPSRFIYNAIGGVELHSASGGYRQEVLARLKQADFISVRDHQTQQMLAQAGIPSQLQPDCVALLPTLFGSTVDQHGQQGEVAAIRHRCANSYLAVQFAAEYGDDASLTTIATQLAAVAAQQQLAIVFFRAGAAPWHDATEVYQRLAALLPGIHTQLFQSLNIWDICALLRHCRAFCGTSLHGRIIANSFSRPAVSFAAAGRYHKLAAYLRSHLPPDGAEVQQPGQFATALLRAMATPKGHLQQHAIQQAAQARQGCAAWLSLL